MDFLYLLKLIILAIVEGITEFVPVSSTGHMILFSDLLKMDIANDPFLRLYVVVIQVGAIMAIIVLYREKVFGSFKSLKPGGQGFNFWLKIAIGMIPAGIIGLLFDDIIEEHFMNSLTVGIALIIGAVLMILFERVYGKEGHTKNIDDISNKQAFTVGIFQTLAILLPGFSRSAATIIGGWRMGLTTVVATEFSFFLAIPTMVLGSLYKIYRFEGSISSVEWFYLLVGTIVSFFVAKVVVASFVGYLQKKGMSVFAVYRLLIGVVVIILFLTK